MQLEVDDVMKGLIMVESNNNPNAVSNKGAIGLTQLMPRTAKAIAEKHNIPFSYKDLTNPEFSVKLSKLHVNDLLQEFDGDWHSVLTAYNRGIYGAKKYQKLYNTNVSSYSKKVLKFATDIKLNEIRDAKTIYNETER